MDVPQLKLLAGLVRGLLAQHNVSVGHNQSLDLIAALPGLRNWPEVLAFPDRVSACRLESVATNRLAYRLKHRHELDFSAEELLGALSPSASPPSEYTPPQIWPAGPRPGVYVTTSQDAIDNLLRRYEEATDGELVYAEDAGSHWDGSIELGAHGLSSRGLSRVPSGTLLIVGPLELNQQGWKSSAEKLDWACIRAQVSGHRVAVLIDTPTPELMFKDIDLMVRSVAPEGDDGYTALAGVVTQDGDLAPRIPFVREVDAPVIEVIDGPTDAIPASVLPDLRQALERRSTGILALGSSVLEEHRAMDLIAALLPLTSGVGPVCRIKSRNRSTPEKDMMVPDCIKPLPFMPSIESAHAHGYRRMIIESAYADIDTLLEYGDDVLFLAGQYALGATEAFLQCGGMRGHDKIDELWEKLVAAVGCGVIETRNGTARIGDLFVPQQELPPGKSRFGVAVDFIEANRLVRWEDELGRLIDDKTVSLAAAKKTFARHRDVEEFFTARAR